MAEWMAAWWGEVNVPISNYAYSVGAILIPSSRLERVEKGKH